METPYDRMGVLTTCSTRENSEFAFGVIRETDGIKPETKTMPNIAERSVR